MRIDWRHGSVGCWWMCVDVIDALTVVSCVTDVLIAEKLMDAGWMGEWIMIVTAWARRGDP